MDKEIITPKEFKDISRRYREALVRRAEQMKKDGEKMTQAAVAKRWSVHAAIVIRAMRTYQPE